MSNTKKPKNKNPMAKALSNNLFRKRIVERKTIYKRKKGNVKDVES